MKKIILLLSAVILGTGALLAQGELTVSFVYERQAGPGSNQFAVYIEDADGSLIRTLYVTKFTADGGYIPRPACVPVWVAKSGIGQMSGAEVDAITSATPQSGILSYVWDMTDTTGQTITDGAYYFVVEGTYWGENQVMFRGEVTVGGDGANITAPALYNSDERKNRGMISEVYAEYFPVVMTVRRNASDKPVIVPAASTDSGSKQ